MEYEELKKFYKDNFSLYYLGNNISNKFALISLVCYVCFKLKAKNPDVTCWSILYKINKAQESPLPEDIIKSLSIICEDFGYGCVEFETFGLEDKQIPNKIKELLSNWLPF